MSDPDYYSDCKFCGACNEYVPYLQSMDHTCCTRSYCTRCGGEVRLFSNEDWSEFKRAMQERRPRGRRRPNEFGEFRKGKKGKDASLAETGPAPEAAEESA